MKSTSTSLYLMLNGTLCPSPQPRSPKPSSFVMVNIWAMDGNTSFGQQNSPPCNVLYAARPPTTWTHDLTIWAHANIQLIKGSK